MPTSARMSLSKFTPSGRNSGNMTEAMNSTVISGTPRISSIKPTQSIRTIGMVERRPSASTIPSGRATKIETDASTRVRNSPPHCEVSTTGSPKDPP